MLARFLGVVCLFALGFMVAQADEIKGKVKKVDADKSVLTLTVDDKDQTFNVPKDAKVVALFGKKVKKAQLQDLPGGLGALKEGTSVTVTTEKKDNKDVVIQVKLD